MRISLLRLLSLALCLSLTTAAPAAEDRAIFWEISLQDEPAGYLLGTIHSEDPRVVDFSGELISRLEENSFFAMEMVPNLPTLSRLTDYMHYQDGSTLVSRIGAERFALLQAALENYSLPAGWVIRMKVWAAMMTLSVPPPETGFFMDFSLSLRAAGAGLKVVGLETLEEQLSFLEDMPMEQQLELLDLALAEYSSVEQAHLQMVDSYLGGDLEILARQAEQLMDGLKPESKAYFLEQGIYARNRRMVANLLPYMQQGRVFIAVGALHLPGESGLVNLLRSHGYRLSPLGLPFLAPEHGSQADQDRDNE